MTCVSIEERTMCQVVRNMGKGKSKVSRTLLLKRIIEHDTNTQKQMYTHAGAMLGEQ